MRDSMQLKSILVSGTALAALALALPSAAAAQSTPQDDEATQPANTPTGAETPDNGADIVGDDPTQDDGATDPTASRIEEPAILVTGSRIRRDPNDSPLPLQIITTRELTREGISNPEQLMMYLTTSGSGPENLASNSDVTTGAQRGTNGLSAANLRGQGSASTLVLLNGRRVAAHGLSGSAVDVNQIPFAALDRIEVLKDGASAIYGTDAIGGVINFITRKDYEGFGVQGFVDITQRGDSPRYRISSVAGYGDLDDQGFNVMASVSYSWNGALRGDQRDFVNTFQPDRGLSPDTRGTPIATAFPLNATTTSATNPNRFPNGTLLGGTAAAQQTNLIIPGTTIRADAGINFLDLPGGAGCGSMSGGGPYDEQLWNNPGARFACAWDTGRAAVLQQPLETLTYYGRGVARLGGTHEVSLELTGSDATAAKRFSHAQISSNTTTTQVAYPLNPITQATYNQVYNRLVALFPAIAANYGDPIAYRWRCIACGPREYVTDTKTFRGALGIDGPLAGKWDYRVGASYAESQSQSVLGSGFYFRDKTQSGGPGLLDVLNSGIINVFSETQTPEARAALESTSARGVVLYGGKYSVKQLDGSISGPLSFFRLPGGQVMVAAGVDFRREEYRFNGDIREVSNRPVIFLAAFDDANAIAYARRDVKAAYAEALFPILDSLEVTGAIRIDEYTGFGSTINPKVSVKFRPFEPLMFRGGYNTGFRVPTFNQIFNGRTESPYAGRDLADPVKCPGGIPNSTDPNCTLIQPTIITGGNPILGPETSEQATLGVVFTPAPLFSASVDWWMINVDNSIGVLTERQLIDNANLFPERFIRDATGTIVEIDRTNINTGARRTQGVEVVLRGGARALGGLLTAGLDGTYLLKKREKLIPSAPFGPSLVGVFSFSGDLGIRWKHNAFVTFAADDWTLSLSQLFREGYKDQQLPGIANGTVTRPNVQENVKNYITYNASLSFTGIKGMGFTLGIRNLFDKDPPFAITYDSNTGAGSSWEPRVADPRGRSFTFAADFKF